MSAVEWTDAERAAAAMALAAYRARDQLAETLRFRSAALDRVVAERDALAAEVAQLRAAMARVQEMTDLTVGSYQPYAVALDDGVHLAVLLDDLREALARAST